MDIEINIKKEELNNLIAENEVEYLNEEVLERDINLKLTELIFDIAIDMGISDIHFEPIENKLKIRFRKDGNLFEFINMDIKNYKSILNIIKIKSKLNIADNRNHQEGRIRRSYKDRYIDLRVSITPIYQGEKIVIRILDNEKFQYNLSNIGLSINEQEYFRNIIKKKSGLILIAGPTGSGKTTTIYTLIKELNSNAKNIYTIEDPIENLISGVNQIQLNGKDKDDIFKYILRQDPDIIVIGEIRDRQTAVLALEASLSGHLVLATIHGFNIVDVILRLKEMEIPDYLLTTAILSISSQMLVKKLCPICKEKDYTSNVYNAVGCNSCIDGYSGRLAVHEITLIDDIYVSNIINSNYTKEYNYIKTYNTNLKKYLEEGVIDEKEYEANN